MRTKGTGYSLAVMSIILSFMVILLCQVGYATESSSLASEDYNKIAVYNHYLAIDSDGDLWAWGNNNYGQVGDGTDQKKGIPAKIMSDVKSVAAGSIHSLALKKDGSLWAWGDNTDGQLGAGAVPNSSKPVKITDDVKSIASGESNSFAIKNDGSLWAWGNNMPLLEDGTMDNCNTPVKIMDGVKSVAAGSGSTMVVTEDGSLWVWGSNNHGQLFDGTNQMKFKPAKVMDGVKAISAGSNCGFVIKEDGTLWACGWNTHGQLGDGTTEDKSTPVKIMDKVRSIASGYSYNLAVKEDGSLWAWGSNYYKQLGDGTTVDKHSPVKIMDGVKEIAAGNGCNIVVKTDGSFWVWGDGSTPGESMLNSMLKQGNSNNKLATPRAGDLMTVTAGDGSHPGKTSVLSLYKKFSIPKGQTIVDAAISSDDKMLVLLSKKSNNSEDTRVGDHYLHTYDITTGKTALLDLPGTEAEFIQISNTGRYAVVFKKPFIYLYDLRNNFEKTEITPTGLPSKTTYTTGDNGIGNNRFVAFSPDDKFIIYTSRDSSLVNWVAAYDTYTTLNLWDIEKKKAAGTYNMTTDSEAICNIRVLDGTTKLICEITKYGENADSLVLFDYNTGKITKLIESFIFRNFDYGYFAINPVQNIIGFLPYNLARVELYNINSGVRMPDITSPSDGPAKRQGTFKAFTYTRDNKGFITTSGDRTIRMWDLATKKNTKTIISDIVPFDVSILGDSKTLMLNMQTEFLMSNDGKKLIKTKKTDYFVKFLDLSTGKSLDSIYDDRLERVFNINHPGFMHRPYRINNLDKYLISANDMNNPSFIDTIYLWLVKVPEK